MNLREIDRLIAEKVMGCEEAPSIWFNDYDKSKKYYCISDTLDKEINIIEYVDRGWVQYLFYPSENIADAWQVVEKLDVEEFSISKFGQEYHVWVEIELGGEGFLIKSKTAPLAICLAALKAVGIEVEAE
jgi:hypothetical protein